MSKKLEKIESKKRPKKSTKADKGKRKKKAHCERIDHLLDKLKDKQRELESQLEKENNPTKRKRIKAEIKIVEAQRKKGQKQRIELEVKCK